MLVPNKQGSPELACVGGPERMPRQQELGPRSHREHIRYFIPTVGESMEEIEHLSTFRPRQRHFTTAPLKRADDLGAGPHPSDDTIVLGKPLAHPLALRFVNEQRHQGGRIPVPHANPDSEAIGPILGQRFGQIQVQRKWRLLENPGHPSLARTDHAGADQARPQFVVVLHGRRH